MAAMALIGNGCMGNAKHAESVSGGTTDSLYLLVGSYARAQEKGIRVYVFNQETGKGTFRSGLSGISNPSFLTPSADGSRVYAVGEDEGISSTANVLSFDRENGRASRICIVCFLHRMVVCCLPMIWVLTVFMHFRSAKRKVRDC